MTKVSSAMVKTMNAEAEKAYPNEACGVLVKRGKKSMVVVCKNVAAEPRYNFTIDPAEYSRVADGGEIIGIWHSHVDQSPEPSDADRVGCEAVELPWFIVSVTKRGDEFVFAGPKVIEPVGFEMPYLERPYVQGVFDCYSLVRDWYRRELGIHLRYYPAVEMDGSQGSRKFVERIETEGFVVIHDVEPQIGDLFLIQTTSDVPEHIAIYIGDDMILHHCHDRLSRRDMYFGYWKKHTVFHLRHKSKC